MNNRNIMGIALVVLAGATVGLLASSVGATVSGFVGKAAWYLPYAALVGAVRCFRFA